MNRYVTAAFTALALIAATALVGVFVFACVMVVIEGGAQ